jgi:hypothetical protein
MNAQSKSLRIKLEKHCAFRQKKICRRKNIMADSDKKDNKSDKKSGSTDKKKKSSTKK